jgi:hypothetical protein
MFLTHPSSCLIVYTASDRKVLVLSAVSRKSIEIFRITRINTIGFGARYFSFASVDCCLEARFVHLFPELVSPHSVWRSHPHYSRCLRPASFLPVCRRHAGLTRSARARTSYGGRKVSRARGESGRAGSGTARCVRPGLIVRRESPPSTADKADLDSACIQRIALPSGNTRCSVCANYRCSFATRLNQLMKSGVDFHLLTMA